MGAPGRRSVMGGTLALAMAGNASWGKARAQGNDLRAAALFPFSGPLALLGDECFRGLELATEERNAAGGIAGRALRLAKADAADIAPATTELRRLISQDKPALLFGTGASPMAFALTQVAELEGVPYVELGAINDQITERGFRNLYRTCARASDFAREALGAVSDRLAPLWGVEPAKVKIALLHEDGSYGQAVAAFQEQQVQARGMMLVERLGYAARGGDQASVVARLRASGADVVLHTGSQNDIVLLYRALRDGGWAPRMIIGNGAGYSLVDTAHAVGPDFNGTLVVDVPPFEVNERAAPGARPFLELYKRRYGSDPRSGHSLSHYSGARIAFDALHRAGGADRDKLRAAMLATDIADGGTPCGWGARFDEKGQNLRARPFLSQWQDGRQVTIAPSEAAMAQLRPTLGETR